MNQNRKEPHVLSKPSHSLHSESKGLKLLTTPTALPLPHCRAPTLMRQIPAAQVQATPVRRPEIPCRTKGHANYWSKPPTLTETPARLEVSHQPTEIQQQSLEGQEIKERKHPFNKNKLRNRLLDLYSAPTPGNMAALEPGYYCTAAVLQHSLCTGK